jgi:hypothetical protein
MVLIQLGSFKIFDLIFFKKKSDLSDGFIRRLRDVWPAADEWPVHARLARAGECAEPFADLDALALGDAERKGPRGLKHEHDRRPELKEADLVALAERANAARAERSDSFRVARAVSYNNLNNLNIQI